MVNVKILLLFVLHTGTMHGQFFTEQTIYGLSKMQKTSFNCQNKILGNYYADTETQCQMFHVCVRVLGVGVQDFRFFCPNGTAFDQEAQICTDWGDVDCHQASFSNGAFFDIFRLNAQKNIYSLSNKTRIKDEVDPLKLQVLSQDNNDDIFKGSYSSNFFANKNKGLEDFNIPKSKSNNNIRENEHKNKNQNYNVKTTLRTTVKSAREKQIREQQRNYHVQKLSENKISTPFKEYTKVENIKVTTLKSVAPFNNVQQKNDQNLYTIQTTTFEPHTKQISNPSNSNNNIIVKIQTQNSQANDFNNNVHPVFVAKKESFLTNSDSYYEKENNEYQKQTRLANTNIKSNRLTSSTKILDFPKEDKDYIQNVFPQSIKSVKNYKSSTPSIQKDILFKDINSKHTIKNQSTSTNRFKYEKINSDNNLMVRERAGPTTKHKSAFQNNYNPTTSSSIRKLDQHYSLPSVEEKVTKKFSTMPIDIDRPTTYRSVYNNLNHILRKKTNENEFVNQNSVRANNKNIYITNTNTSSSHHRLSDDNEEEIFKTSNSYNIGAYRINDFYLRSTEKSVTATIAPPLIANSETTKTPIINRGSVKSYDNNFPKSTRKKAFDSDKPQKNNSHQHLQKQPESQKENSIPQTTRPSKSSTTKVSKDINQYQNEIPKNIPNFFVSYETTKEAIIDKQPKYAFTSTTSQITQPAKQLVKMMKQQTTEKNVEALKKDNNNEDTSYDYAYYDEHKDYGALDVISDFEKIKKP